MNDPLRGAAPFPFKDPTDVVLDEALSWRRRRIRRDWLARFQQPIILLDGGLALDLVNEAAESSFGIYREEGRTKDCFLTSFVSSIVEEEFDFYPNLPTPTFKVRSGGVDAWRRGAGHFFAYPCNTCGEVRPSYWLETERDLQRALRVERSHPVIPFMEVAAVFHKHREFVGCFCSGCLALSGEGYRESA